MSHTIDSLPETKTDETPMNETPMHETHSSAAETRRDFTTQLLAGLLGALVMFIPLVTGILFLLDPLTRKRKGATDDGFLKVTTLDALPADGTPVRMQVIKDITDAWNFFPRQPVGGVYLRKIGDQVLAFNQTCPHLGCAIDYRQAMQAFYCPCHASIFSLDGEKQNVVPPRSMDSLIAEIRNENEVWVRFQNFRGGCPEKVVL